MGKVELQNVKVSFNGETLLKEFNLKIRPQERVILIGPSGQGKTTILKVIGGLFKPTSGQVLIDDQDLYQLREKDRQLISRKMGMLFQKNALFDSLTVADNIAFPLRETTSFSEEEIQNKVNSFLTAVGLDHVPHLHPDKISGGMQKRLGIARALALDPKIILYDDPTAGLDPVTSRKIIDLLLSFQNKISSTLIAVTNDMARAYQLAQRILFVNETEVLETGSPEQTRQHENEKVHQFVRGKNGTTQKDLHS
ncbi:MAG: ATP-binding cassette domain-containing protein [Bdellovibrionales bacterium]|nr:ATP-binding cassette domain-containing protein [Bdellovibrionales bacterium]